MCPDTVTVPRAVEVPAVGAAQAPVAVAVPGGMRGGVQRPVRIEDVQ